MAITRDNPQLLFAGNPGAQSQTNSYTVGAGVTYLVVEVSEWDGTNIADTSVTYNGVAMTVIQKLHGTTGDDNFMLFGLTSPAAGANNVVVSRPSNNLGDISIGAVGYIGVDTSTPTGTPASAQGVSTLPALTVVSATGETVVAGMSYETALSSRGAGQTQLFIDESDEFLTGDEKDGSTSTSLTWTLGASNAWVVAGVSLKPSSSGITVTAPTATATATPSAPSVSISTVAPVATAVAAGVAPGVDITVSAPTATATGGVGVPSVVIGTGVITIVCPTATAFAMGLVPTITLGQLDPEQAETLLIRAAFAVIKNDARVTAKYKVVRLLEVRETQTNSAPGYLSVTGVPVIPTDFPGGDNEDIYVDVYIEPVLNDEKTDRDSAMIMNNEFNAFRKLLFKNLPLKLAGDPSAVTISDTGGFSFKFKGVQFNTEKSHRKPIFCARYKSKINPKTGLFL